MCSFFFIFFFLTVSSNWVMLFAGRFRLAPLANKKLEGRDSRQQLAFKSNEKVAVQVRTIPLDEVIPNSQPVLVLKIDVQGWEYHVLRGASKLLSRKKGEAPYIIYEEDERLLKANNSSSKQICG
ncbi:hypothetical protein LINPERHAP1_LOCUS37622 [Linum perenne]